MIFYIERINDGPRRLIKGQQNLFGNMQQNQKTKLGVAKFPFKKVFQLNCENSFYHIHHIFEDTSHLWPWVFWKHVDSGDKEIPLPTTRGPLVDVPRKAGSVTHFDTSRQRLREIAH